MRPLHLEKKGLRGLAIAESFHQNSKKSILSASTKGFLEKL